MTRIEECAKCKKPFAISGGGDGPMQDYEDIDCPHCGDMWSGEKTAGVYRTAALTPEQEREWLGKQKK
jgi:hypothetical protein